MDRRALSYGDYNIFSEPVTYFHRCRYGAGPFSEAVF